MSRRLAPLFVVLSALTLSAGCGGGYEDGQLEAPEDDRTEEEVEQIRSGFDAAAEIEGD
ncbi:hypothetical protein [Alienimonas sp. DA493]|uniref:hypothetical protein n=1 Tax=Alienimonas sp. DA493 TaxID=3373605 RepID=UPI0037547FC6